VDIGGTNVRAGAYYEDGSPAGPNINHPSEAQEGEAATLQAVRTAIQGAIEASETPPIAIGLAIPGHIDNARGLVRWAPNFGETVDGIFHYWQDVPMREKLARHFQIPMVMDNDANMAALGEYRFGTGRNNAKCLVMFTIGTGIGGGVVMSSDAVLGDARGPLVLVGGNKGGVELGHTIVQHGGVDANVGSYGAIEGYCQRDAIIKRAVHRLRRGRPSVLNDMTGGDLSLITPKMLTDAADQGDNLAIEVWREVGEYLGVGIGSMISVFAPDVFAVGGQIAKAGEWLLGPARRTAENVAVPSLFADATIVQAEQIEDAGMLGAAALAMESLKWNTKTI
jgi:glucokinase